MRLLDNSPVVAAVSALRDSGFRVRLKANDVVSVTPKGIPADVRQVLAAHPEDLRALVATVCGDEGLETRLRCFHDQVNGPFTLRPDIEVRRGFCPSCDAVLESGSVGRCWRCRVALQLVCGAPITASRVATVASAA